MDSDCLTSKFETIDSVLSSVQAINSKIRCEEKGSGDVSQIVSQSKLEMRRCESVMRQVKRPQGQEAIDGQPDRRQEYYQVFAMLMLMVTAVIGLIFELSLFTTEWILSLIHQAFDRVLNIKPEHGNINDEARTIWNLQKKLSNTSAYTIVPVAVLITIYAMFYAVFIVNKFLLLPVPLWMFKK